MLKIAIYASDHGFGHATRMRALAEELITFGVKVIIRTGRPQFLFDGLDPQYYSYSYSICDTGVIHSDGFEVNLQATKAALLDLMGKRLEIVEREVFFLKSEAINLVISDIPFLVADACAYTETPCYAVSNFDWYFIYHALFAHDPEMHPIVNAIGGMYAKMSHAFMLPLGSKQSMSSFASISKCQLLARINGAGKSTRVSLGVPNDQRILACSFGGADDVNLDTEALCNAFDGYVLSRYQGVNAPNHIHVSEELDWLDVVKIADVILCKPGYSSFAEALQLKKPMVVTSRMSYPEESILVLGLPKKVQAVFIDNLNLSVSQWRDTFTRISYPPANQFSSPQANRNVANAILSHYIEKRYGVSNVVSVIDFGSEVTKYMLWDVVRSVPIHEFNLVTGLGSHITLNKKITGSALNQFKKTVRPLLESSVKLSVRRVGLIAGLTRSAENVSSLLDWVAMRGITMMSLSVYQECRSVWHAATHKLPEGAHKVLVIDMGGQDISIVWGVGKRQCVNLAIGLQILAKLASTSPVKMLSCIQNELSNLPQGKFDQIILTGSAATKLVEILDTNSFSKYLNTSYMILTKRDIEAHNIYTTSYIDTHVHVMQNDVNSYIAVEHASTSMLLQILDKYKMSDFLVCKDGLTIGYSIWKLTR